jgi:uncharacterized YigZ family protein
MNHITSVYGHAEAEYIIKKSRFIASLQEVASEDEATAFIEKIRKAYWDARHNCYAYQLGCTGITQRSSDDGEPAGTAGRPLLEVLKKSGITNTVIVVTRYFGGIKLGASGLIRAYSHTAALGLAAADIADYLPYTLVNITFDYSYVSPLERFLPQQEIRIAHRQFADKATFSLEIPTTALEKVEQELINATNGTICWQVTGSTTLPILREKE